LLEEAVLKWYLWQLSSGMGVRGVEIQATAEKVTKHLKLHNFTSSSGWLWRLRQRHNITNRRICGEAGGGDVKSNKPLCGLPENTNDWLELGEGDSGGQLLTEEGISADVIKDFTMEEESDNELDELQESPIKNKLSSARDGIDAVIKYVDSSTSTKLQECYEHLRTVREILIKEQQQRYVYTKIDTSFNLHYYIQNEVQLTSFLSINKCIYSFSIKALQ
jgi:hypothetical protein